MLPSRSYRGTQHVALDNCSFRTVRSPAISSIQSTIDLKYGTRYRVVTPVALYYNSYSGLYTRIQYAFLSCGAMQWIGVRCATASNGKAEFLKFGRRDDPAKEATRLHMKSD